MTQQDRDRYRAALACDRTSRESLVEALRGLQSTDTEEPAVADLHDKLQECLALLDRGPRTPPKLVQPPKLTTRTYSEVGHADLERFVLEVTGVRFDVVSDLECGNDTSHTFLNVVGKVDDEVMLRSFLAGRGADFFTENLLNYLVREGYLAAGHYVVNVSW